MPGHDERRRRKVREWLLLLLRFAVTRHSRDRQAVMALAAELDSAGARWTGAPSFFARTSWEVCQAITAQCDPASLAVLAKHSERIEDVRLRLAFQAAAGIEPPAVSSPTPGKGKRGKTDDLWKGLPSRR
jgi:hypothetical protein